MSILEGKRRAVIVGINRYQRIEEDNIQVLEGAENDARELYERLKNPDTCNFQISSNHFLIGQNATYERIRMAISDLLWKTGTSDIALFYFSGHGFVDSYGIGYLAPYDMFKNDPTVFGIRIQELQEIISKAIDKKCVLLILDCCYSGLATKGDPKAEFERNLDPVGAGEGRIILASTEADAVSREIADCTHNNKGVPHTHGIFTSYLIDGLDGAAADKDGIISVDGLRKYVENKMTEMKKQIPKYSVLEGTRTDVIRIGLDPGTHKSYIENELTGANDIVKLNQKRIDILGLYDAALKIRNVVKSDHNNQTAQKLKQEINKILNKYDGPITKWLTENARDPDHKKEIELISYGLYFKLYNLENALKNFDEFSRTDSLTRDLLDIFTEQIDDAKSSNIQSVLRRLRVVFPKKEAVSSSGSV
jgi:Caspase domain